MAADAADRKSKRTRRSLAIASGFAALSLALLIGFGGYQLLVHPDTPLPRAWNPTRTLVISDPVTPVTGYKLNRALGDFDRCMAVLDGFADLDRRQPLSTSDQCGISDRVDLRGVGGASLVRVETRCAIALRLAMWERHSLQPSARAVLGSEISRIFHFGSFNCRPLRSSAGTSSRMSTHATADAIDISGFQLADGRDISVLHDWAGDGPKAVFLRDARDTACKWFDLTLSPDYNALHADHFHLQSVGRGLCR